MKNLLKNLEMKNLKKMDENQDEYLMNILEFFMKWITGHILARDMDYVQYARTLA
ncbi:hypothetical protein CcarbDRAFT_4409 [Clostridium carboxidivorans P7]|uniref:Uncharacterized protein n=1 Tax=Clostridium carboxidivorans P7 TaxID=536227 RepID=C6Q042_9CLOT|nr:hypothetical protein CcarbDRAFT_4409 [Clostridium carboxidivorans P7]